jgi:hypothetical protein
LNLVHNQDTISATFSYTFGRYPHSTCIILNTGKEEEEKEQKTTNKQQVSKAIQPPAAVRHNMIHAWLVRLFGDGWIRSSEGTGRHRVRGLELWGMATARYIRISDMRLIDTRSSALYFVWNGLVRCFALSASGIPSSYCHIHMSSISSNAYVRSIIAERFL